MKSQYETKYTIPLIIATVITALVFFFVDNMLIESVAFTTLALMLSLNFYEAYIAENKEKHKLKLILSIISFVIFLGYTINLLLR